MPREWKPDLHPRGHGGKFVSKGGGKGPAASAFATADKARKAATVTAEPKPKPTAEAKPRKKAPEQKFRRFSGTLEPAPAPKRLTIRKAERVALYKYTGNEYVSMNEYLSNNRKIRGPARKDPDYVKHVSSNVEALENLINRSPLRKPMSVTRAIPDETATKVFGTVGSKVRKTFTDKRFVSTTKDATPSTGFGSVTLRYRLQAGVLALDVNRFEKSLVGTTLDEHELLLAPGQRFRVLSDRLDERGKRVIELESA